MKYVKEAKKNNTFITDKELKTDLKYIKYYFENLYAGYDILVENGFDINKVTDEIYQKCQSDKKGADKYESDLVCNKIKEVLVGNLNHIDMHLSIMGQNPTQNKVLLFSDIYIKEQNSADGKKYVVYKNQQEPYPEDIKKKMNILAPAEVEPGQEYTGPLSNLYECYDGEEKVYRYCVFTNKNVAKAYINIEGKNVWAPVLPSLSITKSKMQGYASTDETLYISLSDFSFQSGNDNYEEMGRREFQKLCDNAKNLSRGKKNIIIDLRNNPGGDPYMRNAVFANLLYNNSEISDEILKSVAQVGAENEKIMMSPVVASITRRNFAYRIKNKIKKLKFRKTAVKYDFEVFEEDEYRTFFLVHYLYGLLNLVYPVRKLVPSPSVSKKITELPVPDFKGDIYILTNRYSASCSEYSMALAYEFDKFEGINVHHIGENTCGAVSFVNPRYVILPNCGAWFILPSAYNDSEAFKHPNYHGEGEGWYPEYWVSSFQIADILEKNINDPKLADLLKGIERRHL